MIISYKIEFATPAEIIVRARQRSKVETSGLLESIRKRGILNPLILRKEPEGLVLVAGERRLRCAFELGLPKVPFIFFESLSDRDAKIVELEENIKRSDLHWRDHVKAVGEIHEIHLAENPDWKLSDTAEALSYDESTISKLMTIYRALDSAALADADGIQHAYGILARISERRTAALVEDLLRTPTLAQITGPLDVPQIPPDLDIANSLHSDNTRSEYDNSIDGLSHLPAEPIVLGSLSAPPALAGPILNADFIEWAASYQGPKFNLIHCDFPYGVHAADATLEHYENDRSLFFLLTNVLVDNIDRLLSYSAHVVFWLNFQYYEYAKERLSTAGLHVLARPLIWVRSDSKGAAPGLRGTQPRHSYETALLCYRGNRPLTYQGTDSYAAPTVTNPIHPTQKPESMLRYFLAMLIDNYTDFLDPTAGSGSACRVAEELGARTVVGIERDSEFAAAANAICLRERGLRQANAALKASELIL